MAGARPCGTAELRAFAAESGLQAEVLPLVAVGGEKAAATRAKEYLGEGNMPALAALLGGSYFISGTVATEGRHVGRRLGFPTANLHVSPEKVLCAWASMRCMPKSAAERTAASPNYGARPTFGDARLVLESYFDGFEGDLYGRELTVFFDFYIRPVRKFESAEELAGAAFPAIWRGYDDQIGPSGNSESFYAAGYSHTEQSAAFVKERGLDCFEYSFGRGVRMTESKARSIGAAFGAQGVEISVHAPYYINFANPSEESAESSYGYVLDSGRVLAQMGGRRCVFHPATQGKLSREEAVALTEERLKVLCERILCGGAGEPPVLPRNDGQDRADRHP